MGAYLIDNPPARSQYRNPRREAPSGVVVVHTAENTPDYVAFDGGAEAVAGFIRGRSDPGSYHELVDSDSRLQMVPWEMEAFQDGTGSNPHAVGLSVATRADVWPQAPQAWRDGAIENLAQSAASYARWLFTRSGIVIPARRITRSESELRTPGFISHGERDPGRRTDPGAQFPWDRFLARYAQLTQGDDDMAMTPAERKAFVNDIAAETHRRIKADLLTEDATDDAAQVGQRDSLAGLIRRVLGVASKPTSAEQQKSDAETGARLQKLLGP